MAKSVVPALGLASFSCPHCGALAHQHWFRVLVKGFVRDAKPKMSAYADFDMQKVMRIEDEKYRLAMIDFCKRLMRLDVTNFTLQDDEYTRAQLENVHVSMCHSCDGWTIWVKDRIVYPDTNAEIHPVEGMPPELKADFDEAAGIVDQSPRAAAALLRLVIQKVMVVLRQPGKNLNDEIGALVAEGTISPKIQKALDVVRVIGNEAVHPGTIDLNDNKTIAVQLFGLVNTIVETAIVGPAHIDELFETVVPEAKRKAIEARDKPKSLPEAEGPSEKKS